MAFHSAIVSPEGIWWTRAGRQERLWVAIAFGWCMVLFAMMPFWHLKGGQNPSGVRSKVEPAEFRQRVEAFIADYQVGEDSGIPVVAPPPGSDVYLMGKAWEWTPVLHLEEGANYTFHLSSVDFNHGFSLYPANINIQVVPGYDYGLRIVPNKAGEYKIVCNEFCGIGHHRMLGKIVVAEPGDAVARAGDAVEAAPTKEVLR